jgi:hypothetical protein
VIAGADNGGYASRPKALETIEGNSYRLRRRVKAVEKVARMDDSVGPQLQNAIHRGVKDVVNVLLAHIASGLVSFRQVAVAKMGIREMDDAHPSLLSSHPCG